MTDSENKATKSNHKMLIWSLTLTSYIIITWQQRSIRGPMQGLVSLGFVLLMVTLPCDL